MRYEDLLLLAISGKRLLSLYVGAQTRSPEIIRKQNLQPDQYCAGPAALQEGLSILISILTLVENQDA